MGFTSIIKNAASIPAKAVDITTFDDLTEAKDHTIAGIKAITVYAQAVVTGIQVDYLQNDGSVYSAPLRGKADGAKTVIALAADEALIEIAAKSTANGMVALSFAVTNEAGKAKVYGPFGKDPSPAKDGDDDPDLHDLIFGGTNDQGFSFFGSRVAALCGEMSGGKPVGIGAYTLPLVDPGDDVSSSSVISEDFRPDAKGEVETFSNYRNIITVPRGAASVDLWAEEELSVSIAGKAYKLDPVKKTTVSPNALGKVVIDIEVGDVSVPALRVKTDTMSGHWQWCTLYPDGPVHAKIAGLDADALHNNRDKLGIDAKYSKDDCAHVQAAVATLAKASASRSAGPASMEHPNWVLDLRGGATFTPVSSAQAQAINAASKATTDHKQGLGSLVHKATHVVVHTTESAAKTVASSTTSAAKDVAKETVKIADDTAKNAEKVVKDAEKVAKDFDTATKDLGSDLEHGDFKDFGKDFVKDGLQLGLDVAATGFDVYVTIHTPEGEALVYALDHCGKYGKLIGGILTAIAVKTEKLVEFLRDLHDWKAFMVVQKAILDGMETGVHNTITRLQDGKDAIEKKCDAAFDKIKAQLNQQIDSVIKSLGGVTGDGKIKAPSDLAKAASSAKTEAGKLAGDLLKVVEWPLEKLDWLLSKVLDHLPGGKELEKIFAAVTGALGDLASQLLKAAGAAEKDLASALVKSIEDIAAIAKRPKDAPELMVCAVLQLIEGILDAGIDVVKALVRIGFDATVGLMTGVLQALKGTMDLGFISKLYKSLTGEGLSILSLVAWLLAVPATLVHVAIYNRAPRLTAKHAQSDDIDDWPHVSTIVTGITEILAKCMVGFLDIKALVSQVQAQRQGTQLALESGEGADDGVGILTPSMTPDQFAWLEWLSWVVDLIGQGFSVPTSWSITSTQDDVQNFLWLYGCVPLGIDLIGLLAGEKKRMVRAYFDSRVGPIVAGLLAAGEVAWNSCAIHYYGSQDNHPALAGASSLVGPCAGVIEAGYLVFDQSPNPTAAAVLGGIDAVLGIVEGSLTISLGTKKNM